MTGPRDGGWWHGDEWRWGLSNTSSFHPTISVIEPPPDEASKKKPKATVPFGFARAVPRDSVDPLLWEGDGA